MLLLFKCYSYSRIWYLKTQNMQKFIVTATATIPHEIPEEFQVLSGILRKCPLSGTSLVPFAAETGLYQHPVTLHVSFTACFPALHEANFKPTMPDGPWSWFHFFLFHSFSPNNATSCLMSCSYPASWAQHIPQQASLLMSMLTHNHLSKRAETSEWMECQKTSERTNSRRMIFEYEWANRELSRWWVGMSEQTSGWEGDERAWVEEGKSWVYEWTWMSKWRIEQMMSEQMESQVNGEHGGVMQDWANNGHRRTSWGWPVIEWPSRQLNESKMDQEHGTQEWVSTWKD